MNYCCLKQKYRESAESGEHSPTCKFANTEGAHRAFLWAQIQERGLTGTQGLQKGRISTDRLRRVLDALEGL